MGEDVQYCTRNSYKSRVNASLHHMRMQFGYLSAFLTDPDHGRAETCIIINDFVGWI